MTALLFIDLETTGLRNDCTVLEAAWTIADMNGVQRCPLRSRFCAVSPFGMLVPHHRREGDNFPVWSFMSDKDEHEALTMAVGSGLFDDWLACPSSQIVESGAELQRLLLDDIANCCASDEQVHIAGSGVAQFDQQLLRVHCPRVVAPPGEGGGVTHYSSVDQSIVQRTILGKRMTNGLVEWYLASDQKNPGFISIGGAPSYAYSKNNVRDWLWDGACEHRAAPDVARALVAQRALWQLCEPLRTVLGIS